MLTRFCGAFLALVAVCGSPAAQREPVLPARPASIPRLLPGILPGGEVRLPNSWKLRPAGKQVPLGDFPVNLALHPTGKWLAVLHAGYGTHEVMIVDLSKGKEVVTCRVPIAQAWYGLCFGPNGKMLYASGGEF